MKSEVSLSNIYCDQKQGDALLVFLIPYFQVDQSLYQSEAWYATIHIKMSIICMKMESHFHMKGWV